MYGVYYFRYKFQELFEVDFPVSKNLISLNPKITGMTTAI